MSIQAKIPPKGGLDVQILIRRGPHRCEVAVVERGLQTSWSHGGRMGALLAAFMDLAQCLATKHGLSVEELKDAVDMATDPEMWL
jgi:hypothetical protein